MRARGARAGQDGFSLMELMVVMSMTGILMAIAGYGTMNWQRTSEHKGSALALVSFLRKASEQSISEGRTYCVDLAPTRSMQLWRYACSTATGSAVTGVRQTQNARVTLESSVTLPTPAPACPSGDKCVYFYPRGTATPATVIVRSTARSNLYTVHVEGLTARVYM
jgi:prepilin-type N-terminal cleavage/methylation domain-containing protein